MDRSAGVLSGAESSSSHNVVSSMEKSPLDNITESTSRVEKSGSAPSGYVPPTNVTTRTPINPRYKSSAPEFQNMNVSEGMDLKRKGVDWNVDDDGDSPVREDSPLLGGAYRQGQHQDRMPTHSDPLRDWRSPIPLLDVLRQQTILSNNVYRHANINEQSTIPDYHLQHRTWALQHPAYPTGTGRQGMNPSVQLSHPPYPWERVQDTQNHLKHPQNNGPESGTLPRLRHSQSPETYLLKHSGAEINGTERDPPPRLSHPPYPWECAQTQYQRRAIFGSSAGRSQSSYAWECAQPTQTAYEQQHPHFESFGLQHPTYVSQLSDLPVQAPQQMQHNDQNPTMATQEMKTVLSSPRLLLSLNPRSQLFSRRLLRRQRTVSPIGMFSTGSTSADPPMIGARSKTSCVGYPSYPAAGDINNNNKRHSFPLPVSRPLKRNRVYSATESEAIGSPPEVLEVPREVHLSPIPFIKCNSLPQSVGKTNADDGSVVPENSEVLSTSVQGPGGDHVVGLGLHNIEEPMGGIAQWYCIPSAGELELVPTTMDSPRTAFEKDPLRAEHPPISIPALLAPVNLPAAGEVVGLGIYNFQVPVGAIAHWCCFPSFSKLEQIFATMKPPVTTSRSDESPFHAENPEIPLPGADGSDDRLSILIPSLTSGDESQIPHQEVLTSSIESSPITGKRGASVAFFTGQNMTIGRRRRRFRPAWVGIRSDSDLVMRARQKIWNRQKKIAEKRGLRGAAARRRKLSRKNFLRRLTSLANCEH
ncbi:hypothetical protein HK102_004571 [Quaeritorhiza haematococci]|nr:hypothetical protein HK102_004571 [Quaeritorhiza haematococci]